MMKKKRGASDDFIPLDGESEAPAATHSKRDKREAKKAARVRDHATFSKKKLSVSNLPDSCTNEMLSSFFGDVGTVRYAFVVTTPGKAECTGEGFVQFGTEEDCKAALDKLQGAKLLDRKLKLAYAQRRKRSQAVLGVRAVEETPEAAQPAKKAKKSARGRLIVRNLAFRCTEADLRAAFEPFGPLVDVVLALKPDGKPRGFGFVEYATEDEATVAMEKVNGTKIADRVCAVDLCLPKNAFVQRRDDEAAEPATAQDEDDDDEVEVKKEEEEEERDDDDDESSGDGSDDDPEVKRDDDEGDDSDEDGEERKPVDLEALRASEAGRNLFVQNVPFQASKADVVEAFKVYGRVEKVNIVTDPVTKRPKGTCFVVFASADAARACLERNNREASEDFRAKVCGRTVWACEVMAQRDVRDVSNLRKSTGQLTKDKRNLHLANVGRIDNNSGALWTDMSAKDQEKRLSAIRNKAEKLKNPNFIVSTVRLSVRNLPKTVDEHKLRHMFASGSKSLLRQVKIVKDDEGQSKGFGFVEFKEHDVALKALHRVNNNATYFGPDRRPIVEFAVDDARKLELRRRSQAAQEEVKIKKPRWEKKDKTGATDASVAAPEGGEDGASERRKLSKKEKAEKKKRAEARVHIKEAKRQKRAAKRAKLAAAHQEDDLEVLVTDYMGRKKARIDRKLNEK